jgi:hypothetical protein
MATVLKLEDHRLACAVPGCTYRSHNLLPHLMETHNMSAPQYQAAHPGAGVISERLAQAYNEQAPKRKPAPVELKTLSVQLMTFRAQADLGVGEEVCLPTPNGWRWPTKGPAKEAVERGLMALIRRRPFLYWGMPGTGKDALIHVYSAMTRTPALLISFRPGEDIAPMFYTRSIDANGTGWEYGEVWRALTEGILCKDGLRRAPLILLSDVDRADQEQAEWFLLLTDSISQRIKGPDGSTVPLFRDQFGDTPFFVCTANSCGTGDARGRMASARVMDASILDRLGRGIRAHYLHADDEIETFAGLFPDIHAAHPQLIPQLIKAVGAVRQAIEKEEIYAEFTFRGVFEVLTEVEDLMFFRRTSDGGKLLLRGLQAWLGKQDSDTADASRRLMDPHISGGTI